MMDLIEWNLPSSTFPFISRGLIIEKIQTELLLGFIFSIGALTESVVKAAIKAFIKELQDLHSNQYLLYTSLIENLLKLTKDNIKTDRLSASLVKTVDLMVQSNLFNDEDLMQKLVFVPYLLKIMFFISTFFFIFRGIQAEFLNTFIENAKTSSDVMKLLAYVDLYVVIKFE